jgi:hypothetical protein
MPSIHTHTPSDALNTPSHAQAARSSAASALASKLTEHQKQWEASHPAEEQQQNGAVPAKQSSEDRIKHALRNCSPHMVRPQPELLAPRPLELAAWLTGQRRHALDSHLDMHLGSGTPKQTSPELAPQAYALRRLVRGLGSNRAAARQGFAVALGALLGHVGCCSAHDLLQLLDGCLEVSASMKGAVSSWPRPASVLPECLL